MGGHPIFFVALLVLSGSGALGRAEAQETSIRAGGHFLEDERVDTLLREQVGADLKKAFELGNRREPEVRLVRPASSPVVSEEPLAQRSRVDSEEVRRLIEKWENTDAPRYLDFSVISSRVIRIPDSSAPPGLSRRTRTGLVPRDFPGLWRIVGPPEFDGISDVQLPYAYTGLRPDEWPENATNTWILSRSRPMLPVKSDGVSGLGTMTPGPLRKLLQQGEAALLDLALSVGRVRASTDGGEATAFLLEDNVAVTNHHVASAVCDLKAGSTTARPGAVVFWWTRERELTSGFRVVEPIEVPILRCLRSDESLDVAFLEVARDPLLPPALRSRVESRALLEGERIAVIGFPVFDPVYFRDFTEYFDDAVKRFTATFGGKIDDQRVSPGIVRKKIGELPWGPHDATTYPGSSGSLVVSLETLTVIGVHHTGQIATRDLPPGVTVDRMNFLTSFAAMQKSPHLGATLALGRSIAR